MFLLAAADNEAKVAVFCSGLFGDQNLFDVGYHLAKFLPDTPLGDELGKALKKYGCFEQGPFNFPLGLLAFVYYGFGPVAFNLDLTVKESPLELGILYL